MAILAGEVIAHLIDETSWTKRAKALERMATRFAEGSLKSSERQAASDAFRVAVFDGEPLVRRVLAESVKTCTDLPRDVLLALARDVAAVASPILEHSPLLTEDDLLSLALRGSMAQRHAIAGRRVISARVAEALCRPGERPVLNRLLANEGAALAETALHWLLDHFGDTPALVEAVGRRRLLPVSVGARLFGTLPSRRELAERPAARLASDRAARA